MSTNGFGIHHITAICQDAQRTVDFYVGFLGLRFVKKTINFDDPSTYHLYFADAKGTPGTVLTFFHWTGGQSGRRGLGQVGEIGFAIPPDALAFWKARLQEEGISFEQRSIGLERKIVSFLDPDGIQLSLIPSSRPPIGVPWVSSVPEECAIRDFQGVTLIVEKAGPTASLLQEALGFRSIGVFEERHRFAGADCLVDVLAYPGLSHGRTGPGTVHHIAWRIFDEQAQLALRDQLVSQGINVTQVIDRRYFHSIYFREPGGVLFEVATINPGFTVDEPEDQLGQSLQLPPQHEHLRPRLERTLSPLKLPSP